LRSLISAGKPLLRLGVVFGVVGVSSKYAGLRPEGESDCCSPNGVAEIL
jgi:hypothetical protein